MSAVKHTCKWVTIPGNKYKSRAVPVGFKDIDEKLGLTNRIIGTLDNRVKLTDAVKIAKWLKQYPGYPNAQPVKFRGAFTVGWGDAKALKFLNKDGHAKIGLAFGIPKNNVAWHLEYIIECYGKKSLTKQDLAWLIKYKKRNKETK